MARCDCLVSSYPASQTSAPCHRVPREATQGPCLAPALLAGLHPGPTGAVSPRRRGRPRPGASVGRPRAPAARARRPVSSSTCWERAAPSEARPSGAGLRGQGATGQSPSWARHLLHSPERGQPPDAVPVGDGRLPFFPAGHPRDPHVTSPHQSGDVGNGKRDRSGLHL